MEIEQFIRSNGYFRKSRLNSLYSDFQKFQTLNPEGYQANIEAWGNLLNLIIKEGMVKDSKISLPTHNPDLCLYLALPEVGGPKCLGLILHELIEGKQLVPLSSFLDETKSYIDIMNNKPGLFNYLQRSWFGWFKGSFTTNTKKGLLEDRYMSWDALNEQSSYYLSHIELKLLHGTIVDCLFEKNHLLNKLNHKSKISNIDLTTLLKHWSRDLKKCCTTTRNGKTYIKFSSKPINDDDIGIIDLKSNIEYLSVKNSQTESEIDKLNFRLKEMVAKKVDTVRIKHFLKLRKLLVQSLEKLTFSYSQLSSILLKIEDSNINSNIYDQLVAGNKVLHSLNSKFNLDEIDLVKNQIDEEMAKADDITQALTDSKDDINVDAEYEELLKEVNPKVEVPESTSENEKPEDNSIDKELLDKLETLKINDDLGETITESNSEIKQSEESIHAS
jgi:charged multivesicular body protein 7